MRGRIAFLVTLALCVGAGMIGAERADAGLEFTEQVSISNPGSHPDVRFDVLGSGALTPLAAAGGSPYTIPYPSYHTGGSALVTVSDVHAGVGNTMTATLVFDYALAGGWEYASYARGSTYDMVIELGSVTGSATLSGIQFIDRMGTYSNNYNPNLIFNSTFQRLHVAIPTSGFPGAGIPDSQREVVSVILSFGFLGNAGVSFDINAVANPEPGTMALFGLGLAGLAFGVRNRRRRRPAAA